MKKRLSAVLVTTLCAATVLSGCSDPYDVSLDAITNDMTPELMTLNQRPDDVQRHMAYANNVNGRLFWEDLGRVWLTDHPSRLNPIEVPQLSGKPR